MCGYDPFYWYDRMLDQEYEENFLKETEDTEEKAVTDD